MRSFTVNKPKLVATGFLVGAFVTGAIVGGAATAMADRNPDRDKRPRVSYLERLDREVELRPEQRATIDTIVEDYNERVHDLWAKVRPESDQIRAETRAAIAGVLDPEQQPAYDAMNARIDSVRAERKRKHDERHANRDK